MRVIFLRGVMPSGRNSLPKMSVLVDALTAAGFENVQSYLQTGNLNLNSSLSDGDLAKQVHDLILGTFGADLDVIVKDLSDLQGMLAENPFDNSYDWSRIHVFLAQKSFDKAILGELLKRDFGLEKLVVGSYCLYAYLPREAKPKRLTTNFIERQFGISVTMRKLNVIQKLRQKIESQRAT